MILDFTYVHTVQVATRLADDSFGAERAEPASVKCYLQDIAEIVRDGSGAEVTSTAKLNTSLTHAPTTPPVAGQFAYDSTVTLPSGRVARVIKTTRHDSAGVNLGLDHLEVHLT